MDSSPVNPTDLIVIGIVLLSALLAFARGVVREVLSVAGWVGAAFATLYAFPLMRETTRHYVGMPLLADILTGVAIFVVVLLVLSLLSNQVAKGVRGIGLSAVDRSLGFVFGLVRGAVFVCLTYLMISWVLPANEQPPWLRQARTLPVIERGAGLLRSLVPEETRAGAAADVAASVEAAAAKAERAAQEEALRRLSTPAPAAANKSAPKKDSGYKDKDRTDLDRLFETTN